MEKTLVRHQWVLLWRSEFVSPVASSGGRKGAAGGFYIYVRLFPQPTDKLLYAHKNCSRSLSLRPYLFFVSWNLL
ncbi:hypothetical protein J6590_005757 [Homalodisca vitripennis]|nr:hypothetical protein J6590_005757 [Homalodisca vitripennis]